jgi:hypothetical protein
MTTRFVEDADHSVGVTKGHEILSETADPNRIGVRNR